jgi:hypothetical protein
MPIALYSVPSRFPRSYQYWKCQDRWPSEELEQYVDRNVQRIFVHLLRLILALRTLDKYFTEAPATFHIHSNHHVCKNLPLRNLSN